MGRVAVVAAGHTPFGDHRRTAKSLFTEAFAQCLDSADKGLEPARVQEAWIGSLGFGGCFVDLGLLDGEFHARVVTPLLASSRRLEGARRYLAGIDWELVDGLARRHREIAAPVLFVWGEDDPTFPIERARDMLPQLERCRGLVAIPHARLLVHEEQPAAVADAALPFLLE